MMKPGKYWVGDLCYVLGDDCWDEVCELLFADEDNFSGEFDLKDGRRFAYSSTMWGDGVYLDQHGNEYPVDAGMIGCILIKDIKMELASAFDLGNVFNMKNPFTIYRRTDGWDGVIEIGPVRIETD